MEDHEGPVWKRSLEAWLAERRPDPTFGGGAVSAAGSVGAARHVLALARLVTEGISAVSSGCEARDRNSYELVASKLPDLLEFSTFVLAEYTFALDGRQTPGIRFQSSNQEGRVFLSAISFEDVVQWRVDYEGNKLSETLLTLELAEEIRVEGGDGRDWQDQLVDALCRPLASGSDG